MNNYGNPQSQDLASDQKCAPIPMEQGQIPEAQDRLRLHLIVLQNVVGVLEDKLTPIIDLTRPVQDGPASTCSPNVCGLADALNQNDNIVECVIIRLQNIINNSQL